MKHPAKKYIYAHGLRMILLFLAASAAQFGYAFDYPEKGDFAKGSQAWADNCTRCHNMRNPADLRDDQWITTAFHMRIRAGLTGQETRDILTFLQGSNTKPESYEGKGELSASAGSGVTASGKDTYDSTCIACHGANGKGSLPGVPDFTDRNGRLSKPDGELLTNMINGYQSKGSLMAMPAKGGNPALSPADMESVLQYIRDQFAN